MKRKLKLILETTVQKCFDEEWLKKIPLPEYVIEIPGNPQHGHFATNIAMALASSQKRPPREIAQVLTSYLVDQEKIIEKMTVAGPGFINFFIKREEWERILADIVRLGDEYGRSGLGAGEKVLVEFVSANPTGPLHLGHGRGAALGDSLCRILSFCGYGVIREFYINDAGEQIRLLGESIYSRWRQKTDPHYPFPDNGYQGEYIMDLADAISQEIDLGRLHTEEATHLCAQRGKERMLQEIMNDLLQFRISFDVWFKESDLYESGRLEKALEDVRARGEIYEKDGALWIQTSDFGDDKDRVIRKKDGHYTYFASDISYHLDKWGRGFSKAVDIWGADHHGYVARVKAALKASHIHEDWLSVLLIQLVKLWKGGQELKMSKRAGHYVTLKELMDEVGVDAVRFVFLTKNSDSPLDFDIDLVKKHDSDNPVYYVQYAHARICSIFLKADGEGIALPESPEKILRLLTLDEEMEIMGLMAQFPALLEEMCMTLEPHRLTYYLTDLSSLFHKYFNLGTRFPEHRIINQDRSLSQARLFLAQALRVVLRNGLHLLGIQAPDRM